MDDGATGGTGDGARAPDEHGAAPRGRPSALVRSAPGEPPSLHELCLLLAAIRLGELACATKVADEIAARAGAAHDPVDVRAALDAFVDAGLLARSGLPDNRLGVMRSRAFYRVTARGRRALRLALAATDALRAGLPGLTRCG